MHVNLTNTLYTCACVRMRAILSFCRINRGMACSILTERGQVSECEAEQATGERGRGGERKTVQFPYY